MESISSSQAEMLGARTDPPSHWTALVTVWHVSE